MPLISLVLNQLSDQIRHPEFKLKVIPKPQRLSGAFLYIKNVRIILALLIFQQTIHLAFKTNGIHYVSNYI